MRLKSIKVYSIVFAVAIIFQMAAILSYFPIQFMIDQSKTKLDNIQDIEKDFFNVLSIEGSSRSAADKKRNEIVFNLYDTILMKISSSGLFMDDLMIRARKEFFTKMTAFETEQREIHDRINSLLPNMAGSIQYIHSHHIAHLRNLIENGSGERHYDEGKINFKKQHDLSAPETYIIEAILQIHSSMLTIYDTFAKLQAGSSPAGINIEFRGRIKAFYAAVNRFEDYSLDAQDGILIEELLINGRIFGSSFKRFLNLEINHIHSQTLLDQNSEAFSLFLETERGKMLADHRALSHKMRMLQFFSLGVSLLLLFLLLCYGWLIIAGFRSAIEETKNIQNDIEYKIPATEKDFNEWRIVFDALNSMADTIRIQLQKLRNAKTDLETRVNHRTTELQEVNQQLKNEIIEHKQSEERLRQSEEKFKAAFKTSPSVITLTRVEDGIYVDINDAFTTLLGYPPEEVIGKSSMVLNIWNDSKDRDRLVSGLKNDGLVENLQADFKGKDGQIVNGLMSARTLDIENKKYLLAVTQDMTKFREHERERFDLEIRLQQAQKMEAIGTLAGGIAHDFNNILSGIFGYSQLALSKINNTDKVKECIAQIDNGSRRAAELVRQILTFSRQTEYEKHPLQIYIAIKEVLQLLRSSIPTSIEIEKRIGSKAAVLADPTKIHQLLINLCTNAYHAIGENNGRITISLSNKKIEGTGEINTNSFPSGDYLELEVSDTGTGMDKTILEKIFDPYFTTKQVDRGTGLGLAIVKAIVKEHDGFITVTSKPGQGTSFFIYFPVFEGETNQISLTSKELNRLKGNERIMIVDDEKAIRDISEEIIKDHGYKVSTFKNGLDAFTEFEKDPYKYDLVITDMTMPKMSGDKLAIEMRKKNPDIPILLCTGLSETLSKEKASLLGIKKILSKPMALDDLIKNIREVLDGKQT